MGIGQQQQDQKVNFVTYNQSDKQLVSRIEDPEILNKSTTQQQPI